MGYFLFSFYETVYTGMDNTQNDEKLFFYFFNDGFTNRY